MIANQAKLAKKVRKWLGPQGVKHFRDIKKKHGCIDAVWMEGKLPHPVHFREGMQVRNKLRELTDYSYSDHEYDEMWVGIIEEAIKDNRKIYFLDKYGWPVTTFKGRRVLNLFRRLLHTRKITRNWSYTPTPDPNVTTNKPRPLGINDCIFTEYICSECDKKYVHITLANSTEDGESLMEMQSGWRKIDGQWVCKKCSRRPGS